MKPALRFSLLANVLLTTALLVVRQSRPPREAAPSQPSAPPPVTISGPSARPAAFDWSQLESVDYRTYIANLRGIGCPEQTIRDIISADLAGLYARRRAPLADALRGGTAPDAVTLEFQLRKLQREESAVLVALLGGTNLTADPPPALAASNPAPEVSRPLRPKPAAVISIPLFLQPLNPTNLNLNSGQLQAIADLREQFIAQLGGLEQNPDDPAYRDKWLQIQPEYDELLRGMIGTRAYQNYELTARGHFSEEVPTAPPQ